MCFPSGQETEKRSHGTTNEMNQINSPAIETHFHSRGELRRRRMTVDFLPGPPVFYAAITLIESILLLLLFPSPRAAAPRRDARKFSKFRATDATAENNANDSDTRVQKSTTLR